MNTGIFTKCLEIRGVDANEILGVYDLLSGTTGLAFNLTKSTGESYVADIINATSNPLIFLNETSLLGGAFSGDQIARYGYEYEPEDWQQIIDLEFDRCGYTGSTGYNRILISSKDTITQASGFIAGINNANRLFFSCGPNSIYTLNKELSPKSIVSVSLADQEYLSLGVYDFNTELFYQERYNVSQSYSPSNKWYLGNVLTGGAGYTGFSGTVHRAVFLSGNLDEIQSAACAECWFSDAISTGYTTGETITEIITGFELLRISGEEVTGYAFVSGYVTKPDGSTKTVLIHSGEYGDIFQEELLSPLTGSLTGILTGENFYEISYNQSEKAEYTSYSILFDIPLMSGDLVSVYNYGKVNPNVNIPTENFEVSPRTGIKNVIGNGLLETNGVDYTVSDGILIGFVEDDILIQDITSRESIVTVWSGLWSRSKILTGTGPDVYFPPAAQYSESDGIIHTTGISGVCYDNPYYPDFGYDLYMNGQKLVTGVHYEFISSGSQFGIRFSGSGLPDFTADVSYSGMVATGIENVQSSELTFFSKENSPTEAIYLMTGDENLIGNLSGFSEQVWVNGVRQTHGVDYVRYAACGMTSGLENQFDNYSKLIFNNDITRIEN